MSYNLVNPTTGALTKVAGGTLYADIPIGTIISSGAAWDNPPAGYLFCGGQAVSRVTYAALFAIVGTTFGAGDGSTTFNVPELRGEFLRGAGTNQHTGQGNGGAPGHHQDATTIPYTYSNGDANNVNFAGEGTTQNLDSTPTITGKYQTVNSANHGTSSAYNFGTVRPTNTSVNFFIKATNVAVPADFINAVDSVYGPLIPSNASSSNKLVAASDTVKRKDVTITATASIEDDIKTLLDTLIAEPSGVYAGYFTRTGNTSGHYSVSIVGTWNVVGIVSICGATSAAYRAAKFKNTEQGAYTYQVEQLVIENPASVTRMSPIAGGFAVFNLPANTASARIILLDKYGAPALPGSCALTNSSGFTSETDSMWYASITDINTAFSGAGIVNGDAISVKIEITY